MTTFFTFYSFKGGVGRSMALANVADILARRGLRVLVIDFDLEAPGLERYFQVEKTAALANPGLIDLIQSFKKSLSGADSIDDSAQFRQLERFIFPVFQRPLPNGGELHLLTAGQREPAAQYRQYALAVRTFDWQDFYYNWEGEAFFEWLRVELARPANGRLAYDVVLVDSRTGVTEMGGVCAYQLADVIVMLCAANHQNVEGTREVARDFRSDSVRALRRGRALEMVIVPARIEQRDDDLLEKFNQRFNEFFRNEEPAVFAEAGLSFSDLTIPYQPEYAFEEIVVSDPERRENRRDIGCAFELLANALTLLTPPGTDDGLAAQREDALAAIKEELASDAESLVEATKADDESLPTPPPDEVTSLSLPFESPLRKLSPLKSTRKTAAPTHFDPTHRFAGYDVFLSFGSEDFETARTLGSALSDAGINVFVTPSALTPGDQIAESTALALYHSRFLLICAGSRGIGHGQKKEIELAQSASQPIRIVPALLPGAEQDIFSLALRGVADLQAIDLRSWPQDDVAFLQLLHLLRDGEHPRSGDDAGAGKVDNPYAGLQAYDEGRVHLIDLPAGQLAMLLDQLRAGGLAVLFGPTGVGKGSLVAALVAEVRKNGLMPGQPLSVLRFRLGDTDAQQHLDAPAQANQLLIVEDIDHLAAGLYAPGKISLWPLRLTERVRQATPTQPVLLVGNDLPLAAWRCPPAADAALWLRLPAVLCTLPAPDATAVRRAIETPAMRSGFAFEPGLLDRIAKDTGDGPGALPLAQLALNNLWPKAVRGFLTNAAYDACGGIAGAFGNHVDKSLTEVPPPLAESVDNLLLRLVVLADDGSITWQNAVWEDIQSMLSLAEKGGDALLWLLESRVISVWRATPEQLLFNLLCPLGSGHGLQLYSLIAGNTENLIRRRRLLASLAIWQNRQQAPDALLTGYRLEDARSLLREWPDRLTNQERTFIALSVDNAKRASQRRLYASLALGSLLLLAGAGAWTSWRGSHAIDAKDRDLSKAEDNLKALETAFKASIGQGASKDSGYSLDKEAFKGARIYPHFRDARDKEPVGALAFSLRALGLQVEAAEWVKDSPTCGDVRYFNSADGPRAQLLADATEKLMKALGYDFAPDIFDGTANSRLAKEQPGTLEIWLPPLRSLSRDAGLAERVNAKDGAELRPVPGSCAILGSLPDERKRLAARLRVPYIPIYENDLESQRKWVDGFLMYRYEVSNEQFARFQASCQPNAGGNCPSDWKIRGKPREPARFLSWSAADAYCRWAGGRLPSEIEWEKAARGKDGRIWPWGNEAESQRFQGEETSGSKFISEIGRFPGGESPYGIADLAGNLWELTATPWPGAGHVMKGGSYLNPLMEVRASWRWVSSGENKGTDYLGFRCVIDLAPPGTQSTSR